MNRTNLMPAACRAAHRRVKLIRRWTAIAIWHTAAVGCICGIVSLLAGGQTVADAAPVRAEVSKAGLELAADRAELDGERNRLESVMEISDQPDWSILLAVISRTLGDDIVLNLIDTGPADAANTPGRFTVTGVGRSQPAIAQFVLRLESLGLFGRVDLVQTSPRAFSGTDGIGFTLECSALTGAGR